MRTIETAFAGAAGGARPDARPGARAGARAVVLRPPEPGDMGWVVARHGALYAHEYGWDATFEGWVARIVGDLLVAGQADRPDRTRVWVAEVDGERAGSIACAPDDDTTARLRILLVEPHARGLGVGGRLVDECLRFAGRAGYERITLHTYDVLDGARRLYQRAGFTLDRSHPTHVHGHDLTEQHWSRPL